jgi:hypothetical protein
MVIFKFVQDCSEETWNVCLTYGSNLLFQTLELVGGIVAATVARVARFVARLRLLTASAFQARYLLNFVKLLLKLTNLSF